MSASDDSAKPTLWQFVLYFLRLGALGFGGPVALANSMRRDLVEARGWITSEEYENGLALAAACPGPLAYQLAVYCGYVRFGVAGGLAVAVSFGLAPFLIVTFAVWLYVRFAGNWQFRALFYGIAPVVVALIVKSVLEPRQAHAALRQSCLDIRHCRLHDHGRRAKGTRAASPAESVGEFD
jgi:chromate transporter